MSKNRISVSLDNETAVLESLVLVSKIGARAQNAALKDAARKARSLATKAVTSRVGVPQKVLRKRIQVFVKRPKTPTIVSGRLWGGIARPPTAAAHPKVLAVLRRQHPGGSLIRRPRYGFRPAWMTETPAGLREQRLVFDRADVGAELERGVRESMVTAYPKRLRAQFSRLVKQEIVGRPKRRRRK